MCWYFIFALLIYTDIILISTENIVDQKVCFSWISTNKSWSKNAFPLVIFNCNGKLSWYCKTTSKEIVDKVCFFEYQQIKVDKMFKQV